MALITESHENVGELTVKIQRTFLVFHLISVSFTDFQLNLDADLNPVPLKDSENIAHKLAMLLYYRDNYTMYEQKLKGYHQMKQRHLEILGYKVITLSDTLWNAMWMAEPSAKHEYLRNIIWPT